MSVNKVTLVGRLGSDVKFIQNDRNDKASFSLATTEKWTANGERKEKTTWHNIVVWGKMAGICNQYLQKGRQVFVEGSIDNRSWDDATTGEKKYITEIKARDVVFLGGASDGEKKTYTPSAKYEEKRESMAGSVVQDNFLESDVPF